MRDSFYPEPIDSWSSEIANYTYSVIIPLISRSITRKQAGNIIAVMVLSCRNSWKCNSIFVALAVLVSEGYVSGLKCCATLKLGHSPVGSGSSQSKEFCRKSRKASCISEYLDRRMDKSIPNPQEK